ncbi:MAG TPA: AMP-binding protein [Baekduia sp.]|uniref:AMP-binding protein n=1 Tax=Baekduia sp. TaxID=2600305 RepID=UPI002D78F07A|nr:AMP-binding protein [Baekduia sp.]HET6506984.1 AMP-binding protein [Baekduia sp.]
MAIDVTTIGDLADRGAERSPDRDAIVFPDVALTSAQLRERSEAYARSLAGLGVGAGDKVGILMANRAEFVLAVFGAAKLGAVVVPINGRFKAHELSHVVGHGDVRVLLTAAGDGRGATDYVALIAQMLPELAGQDPRALALDGLPELRCIVDVDADRVPAHPGFLARADFEAAAAAVPAEEVRRRQERVRVRDVAILMYTSGTSARPKGCLLTHEALVRHGANVARTRFELTEADSFWDPLPLFHIGGIVPMLGCLATGATYCHAGHFDPEVALRTLQERRCRVIYPAFETIWLAVLDHPRFATTDLGAIELIQSIAVPERLAQLEERMPWAAQVSSYGATECSSNLTLSRADDPYEARIGTLGHPLPGLEIKIVDPATGAVRPAGEVGELCFRGYSLFEGYHKDPELTAASFDADGFFHSQDLALLDADGRLVYAGRLKDMLKVGGENVSALELEGYLLGHPAVNIAQVVAAPDARYDEVPAAFVQLKPGATLTEAELIGFCVGQIATYKVPRYVRVVDDWPMSGTKIQKFVLRERIAEELRAAGIAQAPRVEALTDAAAR